MSTCQDLTGAPEVHGEVRFAGRSLRSNTSTYTTRRRSPSINHFEEVKPDPWTQKNPGWQSQWKKSLVYPATGKNRATVDVDDIARLDEGEFLNDNLISFYLRYLQAELERNRPEVLRKVHIFSSFFFEKLKSSAKYEGVKSWTTKIDLFSYDYIVVPVNEHSHWYLAIICNVGQILPEAQSSEQDKVGRRDGEAGHMSAPKGSASPAQTQPIPIDDDLSSPRTVRILDDVPSPTRLSPEQLKPREPIRGSSSKADTKTPKIITLDSLDGSHSGTCKSLKTYLENEAQDKKGIELPFLPGGMKGKDVPRQDNFCDCGVFVLGYMEEFLKDPDEAARRLLQKERLDWDIRPRELRTKIRDLLFSLQREQQSRLVEEQAKKKALKLQKKAAAAGVSDLSGNNSVAQSRAPSSGPPTSKPSSPNTAKTLARENPLVENASTKEPFEESDAGERLAELPAGAESATVQGILPTLEEANNQTLPPHSPLKVKSLTTDSDSPASQPKSSSSESSGEAFFSAPSSPAKSDQLRSEPPSLLINSVDGVPFVKKIPSSDSEGASTLRRQAKKKKKRNQKKHRVEFEQEHSIQPSVEKDDDEERVNALLPNHESVASEAQPTVSAYFTLAPPSDDRPPPRQSPQDEGIQQSIE
jgi:sentrin-specific protease 7